MTSPASNLAFEHRPSRGGTSSVDIRLPKVSVLMAVHNGEAHLPGAVESLLAQDFTDFEFIIVDDGSDAATARLLEHFAARDRRIRLLRNETCLKLPVSLNRGLAYCIAPLTARADADDVYAPNRLSRQVAFMNERPEIGVLSCGWYRMSEAGEHLGTVSPVTDPDRIAFERLFINRLLHPGVMFRTELVKGAGGYDPRHWTAQDSELWARLAGTTRMTNLPDPLVHYRIHANSTVRRRGAAGKALSLSVPAGQIADYLGGRLDDVQVQAMVRLYQSREPLDLRETLLAERGLARIHAVARRRELPHVLATFERIVSDRLIETARTHARADRATALRLVLQAAAWRLNHRYALRLGRRLTQRVRAVPQ